MEQKHKVVLVPMPESAKSHIGKTGDRISFNELLYTHTFGIAVAQQLLVVSDEKLSDGDWMLETGMIKGIGKWNPQAKQNAHYHKIIAAYPAISGIPTIELSDIREMEKMGWPESVELKIEPLTTEMKSVDSILMLDKRPIYVHKIIDNHVVINWEPTETKSEIVEVVMTADEYIDKSLGYLSPNKEGWKAIVKGYAKYYHEAMTEQANKQARNGPDKQFYSFSLTYWENGEMKTVEMVPPEGWNISAGARQKEE